MESQDWDYSSELQAQIYPKPLEPQEHQQTQLWMEGGLVSPGSLEGTETHRGAIDMACLHALYWKVLFDKLLIYRSML